MILLCAYVRHWPGRGLVFECVTCFYCCFSKFGLCANCSEKLVECSPSRAPKILPQLAFSDSRKVCSNPVWQTWGKLGKDAGTMNICGNILFRFAGVLLKLTPSRKAPVKVEIHLKTRRHVEYYCFYIRSSERVRHVWLQLT